MELITISFDKWAKWNPRKDIKNPTWFAMSNRITEDDQIQTLSDKEFRAFIHLFCLASQQQGTHEASVNLAKAERVTGMSKVAFIKTIEQLSKLGICTVVDQPHVQITYGSRTDGVQIVSATEQYNTEQDITGDARPQTVEPAIAILKVDKRTADFIASVKPDVQSAWLAVYGDQRWVEQEVAAAFAWTLANPQRAPKSNVSSFLTNWLKRGWDRHRKTLPTTRVMKPIPQSGFRLDGTSQAPEQAESGPVTTNRETLEALLAKAGNLGVPKKGAS